VLLVGPAWLSVMCDAGSRTARWVDGLKRAFRAVVVSNSRFRRRAFAVLSWSLTRFTVNAAFRSAAAGVDTRSSNSIFDSASLTLGVPGRPRKTL
jgi:hypothetical protein